MHKNAGKGTKLPSRGYSCPSPFPQPAYTSTGLVLLTLGSWVTAACNWLTLPEFFYSFSHCKENLLNPKQHQQTNRMALMQSKGTLANHEARNICLLQFEALSSAENKKDYLPEEANLKICWCTIDREREYIFLGTLERMKQITLCATQLRQEI